MKFLNLGFVTWPHLLSIASSPLTGSDVGSDFYRKWHHNRQQWCLVSQEMVLGVQVLERRKVSWKQHIFCHTLYGCNGVRCGVKLRIFCYLSIILQGCSLFRVSCLCISFCEASTRYASVNSGSHQDPLLRSREELFASDLTPTNIKNRHCTRKWRAVMVQQRWSKMTEAEDRFTMLINLTRVPQIAELLMWWIILRFEMLMQCFLTSLGFIHPLPLNGAFPFTPLRMHVPISTVRNVCTTSKMLHADLFAQLYNQMLWNYEIPKY